MVKIIGKYSILLSYTGISRYAILYFIHFIFIVIYSFIILIFTICYSFIYTILRTNLFIYLSFLSLPYSTVGAYHVGFTTDINQLINILHERFPKKYMYLCGFSLGGNVSLKFLGELNETAEQKGLYGAAVTCVPFDPTSSQAKLDVGFNRAVYSMVSIV